MPVNEHAKVSMGFARIHVDRLAKLSSRKVALTPVEDVIRELSEVFFHIGGAVIQQPADDKELAEELKNAHLEVPQQESEAAHLFSSP